MLARLGMIARPGNPSQARLLAGAETNALTVDFTDLSAVIRDTVTPANNFSGNPNTKLTYTAPSTKWILGSNGLYSSGTTLRTEYNTSGVALGLRLEEQRIWLALQNRDGAQAAWTKTNGTATRTATGADGVSSNATTFTATSANATIIQNITSGAATRITSLLIRRRTGSGTIELTQDNGATWTDITSGVTSAGYVVKATPSASLANPQVGIRLATSGDAIDFDFFGHEVGSFVTSPVEVAGASVTRTADFVKIADSLFNCSDTVGTLYAKINKPTANLTGFSRVMQLNNADASDKSGFYLSGAGVVTEADGLSIDPGSYSVTGGVSNKIAISFQNASQSSMVNANALITNTNAFTVALDRLQIGNNAGSGQVLNGWMQQFAYFPRRFTDPQLQALTA